ncbi:MAG: PaaI family thioesterase [Peptococcaceae bacterium]
MFFREPQNNGLDCRLFGTLLNLNEECPFHNLIDMYIVELSPGEAVLEIPIQNDHLNPNNIVHGGVTFSLADTAMGMAIRTLNHNSVTIETNINYLKPAQKSDILKVVGKVVEFGRKIIVTEAIIYNKAGDKAAVARGTYYNKGVYLEPVQY